ncbi:unnamed protein product [Microthlaspi erraticum]|uniref:peroxidase n=1 Tax=Microthlaspi erraticum TaxID=1685480 RepID=A0A6D2KJY0_9BRAS|nr:unnamed protein product [Microthlaspi erraticum]
MGVYLSNYYYVLIIVFVLGKEVRSQSLKNGYYSTSCPKAESIVRSTVESHFDSDPTISPGLLRLHFHDCFVQGCDGSVLIKGKSAEQAALPKLSLKGMEVIDDAKARLETECPGVVSCADILALAARDSVDLSSGPSWRVPTGRKDGRISLASEASNLPSPLDSVAVQKQKFQAKGLDIHDLVTLLGSCKCANLLNIRDTELSRHISEKTGVEEKRSKAQKESNVLLDYTRKAIPRLTYLKKILAQLEDDVVPCESQMENWKTNLAWILMISLLF